MTTTWHPWQRLHLVRPRTFNLRLNPLQALAPALGVVSLLAGLIAIGHSGFHAERVYDPHDALAGVHYTPLLAACVMGFGLFMLVGAELVRLGRSRIHVFGDIALGLGTVVLTCASTSRSSPAPSRSSRPSRRRSPCDASPPRRSPPRSPTTPRRRPELAPALTRRPRARPSSARKKRPDGATGGVPALI